MTRLNDPELLARIEHAGGVQRLSGMQVRLLGALLDAQRLQHLVKIETLGRPDPYRVSFLWRTPIGIVLSEVRPLVRAQLLRLQADARQGAATARDPTTRAHLRDTVARVDAILERARTGD